MVKLIIHKGGKMSFTLKSIEEKLKFYGTVTNPVEVAWRDVCEIHSIEDGSAYFQLGDFFSKMAWFTESSNAYHNGLHTAHVLYSGAVLLSLEIKENPLILDKNVFDRITPYFLIALMFHDYKHNGKTNKTPFELEEASCDEFSRILLLNEDFYNLWSEIEFDIQDNLKHIKSIISVLICATEVATATKECQNVYLQEKEDKNMESFSAMSVLMSEADLMASVLTETGIENGKKLAEELNFPAIATSAGRLGFLKSLKYVSFAAESLKIQEAIDNEINELKK